MDSVKTPTGLAATAECKTGLLITAMQIYHIWQRLFMLFVAELRIWPSERQRRRSRPGVAATRAAANCTFRYYSCMVCAKRINPIGYGWNGESYLGRISPIGLRNATGTGPGTIFSVLCRVNVAEFYSAINIKVCFLDWGKQRKTRHMIWM